MISKKYFLLFMSLCSMFLPLYSDVIVSETLSVAEVGRDIFGLNLSVNDNGHAMAVWTVDDSGTTRVQAAYFDGSSWTVPGSMEFIDDSDGGIMPWVSINNNDSNPKNPKAVAVWITAFDPVSASSQKIKTNTYINGFWQGVQEIPIANSGDHFKANPSNATFPATRLKVAVSPVGNAIVAWNAITSVGGTAFYSRVAPDTTGIGAGIPVWNTAALSNLQSTRSNSSFFSTIVQNFVMNDAGNIYLAWGMYGNTINFDGDELSSLYSIYTDSSNSWVGSPLNINNTPLSGFVNGTTDDGVVSCDFTSGINTGSPEDFFSAITQKRSTTKGNDLQLNDVKPNSASCTESPDSETINGSTISLSGVPGSGVLNKHIAFPIDDSSEYKIYYQTFPGTDPIADTCDFSNYNSIDEDSTYVRLNPMICSTDNNLAALAWNSQGMSENVIKLILHYNGTWHDDCIITLPNSNLKTATTPSPDLPFYLTCSRKIVGGNAHAGIIWWDNLNGVVRSVLTVDTGLLMGATPPEINDVICTDPTTVKLFWTPSTTSGILSQEVLRKEGAGSFMSIASVAPGVSTYEDTPVTAGTEYTYIIRALGPGGICGDSAPIQITCSATPPPPVSTLDGVCDNGGTLDSVQIKLTWTGPQNIGLINHFVLFRSPAFTGGNPIEFEPPTDFFIDTDVVQGQQYTYSMYTVDFTSPTGQSSKPVITKVGPCYNDEVVPPTNLGLSCSTPMPGPVVEVDLTWCPPPSDSEIEFQRVFRQELPGGLSELGGNLAPDANSFTDSTALAATLYEYSVISYRCVSGNTIASRPASQCITTCESPDLRPLPPSNINADCAPGGDLMILVTWTLPTQAGVTSQKIYRNGQLLTTIDDGTTTSYCDSAIIADFPYYYTVTTVRGILESDVPPATDPITCFSDAPNKITDLSATCGAGLTAIQLNWTLPDMPPSTPITQQQIFRNGNLIATIAGDATSYIDTPFAPGLQYFYFIRAYNNNVFTRSNIISIRCIPDIPSTPVIDIARCILDILKNPVVQLEWTPSPDTNIAKQIIYRNNVNIAEVGPTVSTFDDTNVAKGATYSYNIAAVTDDDVEGKSITIPTTCPAAPEPPTAVEAQCAIDVDEQQCVVNINWMLSPSNNIVSQNIYRNNTITPIASVEPDEQSYTDNDIVKGDIYTYYVSAVKADDNESELAFASPIICNENQPLYPIITRIDCDSDNKGVTIHWDLDSTTIPVTSQCITRDSVVIASSLPAGDRSYHDTGLTIGQEYTYRVIAKNTAGSSNSNLMSVRCVPDKPERPCKNNPDGCNIECKLNSNNTVDVTLKWEPSTTPDVTKQIIYRNNAPLAEVGPSVTSYTDSNVGSDVQYHYNIAAVVESNSAESRSSTLDITCTRKSLKVTNLAGICAPNIFPMQLEYVKQFTWTPSTSTNVVKQNIYRDGVLIASVPPGQNEFFDHDRPPTAETYTVRSANIRGRESSPVSIVISCN